MVNHPLALCFSGGIIFYILQAKKVEPFSPKIPLHTTDRDKICTVFLSETGRNRPFRCVFQFYIN